GGVAGGWRAGGAAGVAQAATFGVFHHGHGDAVLDAPSRIQRLDLGDHGGAARLGQAIESHHGRVPDELQDIGGDRRSAHGGAPQMWYIGRAALSRSRTRSARSPKVRRSITRDTASEISSHSSIRS